MTTPAKLVFGDDGTASSDAAWEWVDHQRWTGWALHVVQAEPPPFGPPPDQADRVLHPWDPPIQRVPQEAAGFVDVVYLTAMLDPRLALSLDTDLIVVGRPAHGRFRTFHLGSTAEWLMEHPPAPLVMARTTTPVTSVLVCDDGSSHSARATQALLATPWITDVAITVVVVDDGRIDVTAVSEAAGRTFGAIGVESEVIVLRGKPTSVVLDQLERRSPDLVVLGTRGNTGLHRLRVGSTASAVARAAEGSVLVACAEPLEAATEMHTSKA